MPVGSITDHIDLAQIALYLFWVFFAILIFYLCAENRREGFPVEKEIPDPRGRKGSWDFIFIPDPKTFNLTHGGTLKAPNYVADERPINAKSIAPWPGAPLRPLGDPMRDGVGPAAWAEREDEPELTYEGLPSIVPLRIADDAFIASGDPDPRGMQVIAGDRKVAGIVNDVWIDRAEPQIRYFEVDVHASISPEPRRVLVPMTFSVIDGRRRKVKVRSIMARHFAYVPTIKNPDEVTKLEEDKIVAFYGGGTLYATVSRTEPLL